MKPYGVFLRHLQKTKGGRLPDTTTFIAECEAHKADVAWLIDDTIRAGEDSADDFAFIGKTLVLDKLFVVKIMLNSDMAEKETQMLQLFREHPHQNVVQGIYHVTCKDEPSRWTKPLRKKELCIPTGSTDVTFIIQEYIEGGDLTKHGKLPTSQWASIAMQLTYTCIELYEKFGLLYGDWHAGNILLDTTEEAEHHYECKTLDKHFTVETHGLRPVLTDFSRCDVYPHDEKVPWQLADQISTVWDVLYIKCLDKDVGNYFKEKRMKVGVADGIPAIVKMVEEAHAFVKKLM
jgi:serine/threonine protein kinase